MSVRPSTIIFNRSLTLAVAILAMHFITIWMAPFEIVHPTLPAIAILAAYLVARIFLALRVGVERTAKQ
jgi:hypothetical protein